MRFKEPSNKKQSIAEKCCDIIISELSYDDLTVEYDKGYLKALIMHAIENGVKTKIIE